MEKELDRRYDWYLEDYYLFVLIAHTRKALFKLREIELRKYNISAEKNAALYAIYALGDKATPAEVARWRFREYHTISELLSIMEKDGLISKVEDVGRRKRVKLYLTPKGLKIVQQTAKRKIFHKVMSCLSEEERAQLRTSLWNLLDKAVEELGIKYELPFPPRS